MVLFSAVLLSFSGCGEISNESTYGSGHDTLNVKLLDTKTVQFTWNKKYNGYSEVLLRQEGENSRTGYFMTHNYTGNYQLTCYIAHTYSNYADFECSSTGSKSLSSSATLPRVYFDTIYNVQMSEGLEHNYQAVTARLTYDSSSQALVLN